MKRVRQKFFRAPIYVWLLGLIAVLIVDWAIDADEGGGLVSLLWGMGWFFLAATVVASIAVCVRLLRTRGRGVGPHQVALASVGLVVAGLVAISVVAG
jgi:hypothetical protein